MAKPEAEEDREKRIENLKRHAAELCGGQMEIANLDDYSAEAEEAFWKQVVDYEEAPWTTHFQQLLSESWSRARFNVAASFPLIRAPRVDLK